MASTGVSGASREGMARGGRQQHFAAPSVSNPAARYIKPSVYPQNTHPG